MTAVKRTCCGSREPIANQPLAQFSLGREEHPPIFWDTAGFSVVVIDSAGPIWIMGPAFAKRVCFREG
jgi:hypothetical protein